MNASLRFGCRYALDAMPARFKFQSRVRALANDARNHFFVAADFAEGLRNDFDLPALTFGIAGIHAEKIARKQRGLVATGAAANLENNILVVVRVFG